MNIHLTLKGKPRKRMTFQWTEENISIAAKMWAEGAPGPVIAERLGVSKGSVTATASKFRDRFPRRLTKEPEDGIYPKVPAAWLEKASELWLSGKNGHQISVITRISSSTAYDRIRGRPDLFPERRPIDPTRSARTETRLGDDIVIYHAKRMHITGEVHTMPRVSIINGMENPHAGN